LTKSDQFPISLLLHVEPRSRNFDAWIGDKFWHLMTSIEARSQARAVQQGFEPGLISIIIPTFDRGQIICDALNSVASQDYPNVEILVVDDGSTDDTTEVIAAWRANNPSTRLKYVRQHNKGVAAARNHGIEISTGEFIQFLDSDDFVCPRSLSMLVAALRATDAPYALGKIVNTDMQGQVISGQYFHEWMSSANSVLGNLWLTHAALYRRFAVLAAGFYNEDLGCGEDTEFHWRIAARNGVGVGIEETIAIRRIHDLGQLTDQDPVEQEKNDLATYVCFQEWALGQNLLKEDDRKVLRRRHRKRGTQLGSAGKWTEKNASIDMIAKLYPDRYIWERALGLPKSRSYYAVCLGCLRVYQILQALVSRYLVTRR
jgi:hypothetical protein